MTTTKITRRSKATLAKLARERAQAVAAYKEAERAYGAAVAALPEYIALKQAERNRDAACTRYLFAI
jgi:hypothetical protein